MLTCSACATENRPGRRFCSRCGAALESACGSCGAANDPGDRYCGSCGAALSDAQPPATPPVLVSERRLVSVLFADLVGFTTLSEHRDPDEVRELLSLYFDRCRTLIERYGGTVAKFIGDAVMAVWGTPVAREDDAERAVRAALTLTRAVSALGEEVGMPGLRVRAGVLTGSAAVQVGSEVEGMVLGDTVNTASRLQSLAAPGSVLVDDVTRRASEAAIVYEDAGTHQVKGREQPVRAFAALRVVAGVRGARRRVGLEPPFVGRDRQLGLVVEAAADSAERRVARLVAVTGEAGSGKSRLLWEFFKYTDGIEQNRWWHQGRCLSYGEGVAYWALAEMIRARAGITEEEDPADAREKLHATVERYVTDERERRLVEPRLAHLLGLEQRTVTERGDLFSGWRLFFESMAASEPVILAFEDLQWADSGLLDFIDYLIEWSADFPIFILALGRPELESRRPGWGTVARLLPLEPAAMQALLEGLVPGLPGDLTSRILERAEGVPLYAVETVRMLLDHRLLTEDGGRYVVSGTIANLDVPETLHALVAARLDNLEHDERALLQDAAVLGVSFTPAALAAVSGRPEAAVRRTLDHLVSKQVLGRDDDPRLADAGQYHFLQALLRTIALGRLSRRHRKASHLAAANHLRSAWGDAPEIAEVLASHYLDAVAADPDAADADAIRSLARETLAAAGRRAGSLALAAEARRYFERAAELAGDEVERAALLADAGVAAHHAADTNSARRLLANAIGVLEAAGLAEAAARTRGLLADALIADNRINDAVEVLDQASAPLTDEPLIAELAARRAWLAFLTGDYAVAHEQAELALSIADPRRLLSVVANAANTKAAALQYAGRHIEAEAMMALALKVSLEADIVDQALRGYHNLGEVRANDAGLDDGLALLEQGVQLARERGDRSWERQLLAHMVHVQACRGEWAEAMRITEALRADGDDEAYRTAAAELSLIFAARGDAAGIEAWLAPSSSPSEWHELAAMEDISRAAALRVTGQRDEAAELMASVATRVCASGLTEALALAALALSEMIDTLLDAGDTERVSELVARSERLRPAGLEGQLGRGRGLLHAAAGQLVTAEAELAEGVRLVRSVGIQFPLARGLLDHGRIWIELGRMDEAVPLLDEARAIFERLGAVPWVERSDLALAHAAA
jgi:class 3 adenylate cyclase